MLVGILFYVLLHLPAIIPLYRVYSGFSKKSEPRAFQFGIPELLILPVIATPTILMWFAAYNELGEPSYFGKWSGVAVCYYVTVFEFSWGLFIWSAAPPKSWRAALYILLGALFGILVLIVSFYVFAFLFVPFLR